MEYDIGADESVSATVVRAVSAVEGHEPRSLRPLTDVVDPDALDALFSVRHDGEPRIGGRVSFVYSDCLVDVDHDEYLTVRPLGGLSRTPTAEGREPGGEDSTRQSSGRP